MSDLVWLFYRGSAKPGLESGVDPRSHICLRVEISPLCGKFFLSIQITLSGPRTMSRRIGRVEVAYTKSDPKYQNWWTGFKPSRTYLPQGWQRDPDRLALREPLIWDKDVEILLRDGSKLRADIFRPATSEGRKLPALLTWSPYGKTGTG